jgi:xylulokinase
MSIVLSIDLGTSGCRSALYDEKLNMLASESVSYPLILISDTEVEQDANLWWSSVKETIQMVVVGSGVKASEIAGISVSAQGISYVPLDSKGDTLCNSVSWLDTRAAKETEELNSRYGADEIYRITGKRLSPLYTLPKLMKLRSDKPDIYEKAWKLLLPMDYIMLKLCGRCVTDHTMAAGTMFYDIRNCCWSDKLLRDNCIDISKLPELCYAGETAETILPTVAEELGLSKKAVVAVGGQDQKCAALSAGVSRTVATVSLGTGGCITRLFDTPVLDDKMRIPAFTFLLEDTWELEGLINTAASAYQWFRDNFTPTVSFAELDSFAEKAGGPLKEMFFPYLQGDASPNWSGGSGTFTGLAIISDLPRLARAVLEGVAYRIKENVEVIDSFSGETCELRIFGGGAKSDLWCNIISEATNKPVSRLPSSDAALAGAAMLAFKAINNIMPEPFIPKQTFYPDTEKSRMYQDAYYDYEKIRRIYFKSSQKNMR